MSGIGSVKRILLCILLLYVFLLSACFEDSTPPPVVNAWYQAGSASHFYVVRSDDTIYSVAFAFGLNYRDLAMVNNLTPPYALRTGQRLKMTHRPTLSAKNQFANYPAKIKFSDTLLLSSDWCLPAQGRVLQHFSMRSDGHRGISIGGQLGEPIHAASNGVVVYSGDNVRGYGNLIIIKKSDQYLSAYAHNQRNLVNVGERVRKGQVIARMGQDDAGRTLLYFEIRRDGVPVDPMNFYR
ncbi:MAG: peptidoglycan DD-metalloendopeptidase family protein [Gammaproteobacteria bacterium]|nr:peptidoglycan DD-metalloendopeptidase family protein [Gammaproteobacteria bacterium]